MSNHEVAMDTLQVPISRAALCEKPLLHMINVQSHLSAGPEQSASSGWYLSCLSEESP